MKKSLFLDGGVAFLAPIGVAKLASMNAQDDGAISDRALEMARNGALLGGIAFALVGLSVRSSRSTAIGAGLIASGYTLALVGALGPNRRLGA